MAGLVRQPHQILDKPGLKLAVLPDNLSIEEVCPYVSRGGLKLKGALDHFHIVPQDWVCLDVGASTGGFTDCLLQHGARLVYAVDVGYGQLDWTLRNHEQVRCFEKVNARYLKPEDLYGPEEPRAQMAVMDVSFISILKILPALYHLLSEDGFLLSLIKPQFEAEAKQNRKGIVRSEKVQQEVIERIRSQAPEHGFFLHEVVPSDIQGKGGNQEFLGVFYKYPPQEGEQISHGDPAH